MAYRSLLFAPGNEPRKVQKVGTLGADGVILDLEDAVPMDDKIATRAVVKEAVPSVKAVAGRVYVRINPVGQKTDFSADFGIGDIEEVVCPGLDGLVVPKVESPKEMKQVDEVLREREKSLGLPEGGIKLIPIIETALGLWNAYDIAGSSERIEALNFGAGDFTRDTGVEWSRDEAELLYARSRVVVISRAAGIQPPLDTVWLWLEDDEGMAASTRRARALGFQGKICIHPRQVTIVNEVFSYVSPEELKQARKIVEAFAEAQARGVASIRVDGEFVDYPIVEKAKRVLELDAESQKKDR